MDKKYEKISQDLGVSLKQIDTVLALTAEGNTIPFIARYRKEATGNLDEVVIKGIIDLDKSLTALAERKEAVLAKIEEQGKLTPELKKAIEEAEKLADVEELYLPYKEKRRTKATIAREAGLFPLARLILQNLPDLEKEAQAFVCEGFETPEACLAGPSLRIPSSEPGPIRKSYRTLLSYPASRTRQRMKNWSSKSTMISQKRSARCRATGPWPSTVERKSVPSKSPLSTIWTRSYDSLPFASLRKIVISRKPFLRR